MGTSGVNHDPGDEFRMSLGSAYTVKRELGGGGMSRVFVARDEQLGRDVVVKVLSPALAEAVSAERFSREIRLAAALQEPHIVPVHAAGMTAEGLPYYTMPYVEGESLRARLRRGPLAVGEAVSILRDVAKALAYAHGRGVVHRDIKPENILLSSGTAVVTDFGIAKALQLSRAPSTDGRGGVRDDALTQAGTSLGTPAYMAPEQAAGDPATDHRADLYAWGVMAYELLAGRHPFSDRASPHQMMMAHFAEMPVPLVSTGSGASRPIADLVMRALAKDPAQRPPSATDLLAVLDGLQTSGAEPALPRRFRIGGGVAATVLALAAAMLWWQSQRGQGAREESAGPLMLAVLPFENAGPADQSPFVDGLTDALTAKLGALPSLVVIDRRSAAQYRQTTKTARQIGSELGVRYLLEGVVHWAKDSSGTWRAQVTPTLVDARNATTRWAGEPVVITPDDPFTAQGAIATKVAEALQVAIRPADHASLARKFSDNSDAFAAYQRGRALYDAAARSSDYPYQTRLAAEEFARAVALDSTFAEAWGWLANIHRRLAMDAPGDRVAEARMRATLAHALTRAPDQSLVLLTLARQRLYFDHDTAGVNSLVQRAIAGAPNDAFILGAASSVLASRERYDTAYALIRRSAERDPRSPGTISSAASMATAMRRWDDAHRFANALTALDSTDERGWSSHLGAYRAVGDTLSMQRELNVALAVLPKPSNKVLSHMAYAGGAHGLRYAALSARELGVSTLLDSVWNFYDNKSDVFLRLGDTARVRVYADSIRTKLVSRQLSGPDERTLLTALTVAQANLGQMAEARRTLARALTVARRVSSRPDLADALDPISMAHVYARLGEPETAVRWLEAGLANPAGSWTTRAYAVEPKLVVLHGQTAFERLLRERAQ